MAGEGGKGAFRVCIPHSQNSGAQSKLFRRFVSDCSPGKGKPFMVRMKGGCNVRNGKRADNSPPSPPLAPRADGGGHGTTFNASSNVLYSWDNMTYMYVPLQELQNGHYRIDVNVSGPVRGLQVLDSDGDEHYTAGAVSDGHVVEFDVSDADVDGDSDPLPAGLFLDVDAAVDVSYAANATLQNPQADIESCADSGLKLPVVSWFTGAALLLAVALL